MLNGGDFLTFEIGIQSADFSIMERKISILSKENSPCRTYSEEVESSNSNINININNSNSDDEDDSPGFISCARRNIWKTLSEKINCTLPAFAEFIPNNGTGLNKCEEKTEAWNSYLVFHGLIYSFIARPDHYGCPLPCSDRKYNFHVKYFHETSWIEYDENPSGSKTKFNFILFFFYHSLNVEERIESYVYDVGNALTSVGGNLGLTLGISCVSILLGTVKIIKRICSKFYF